MSLEKYGLQKPVLRCANCYQKIKEIEKIDCEGCHKAICIYCSFEYDNGEFCQNCHRDIEQGKCC